MPNEMIRPCTWKGETFDAIRVKRVLNTGNGVTICLNMGQSFILQCDANDVDSLYFEAIATIAEALNAPVLATEAVLKDLPKDAKACAASNEGYSYPLFWNKEVEIWEIHHNKHIVNVIADCFLIKPNGCPKTAEYLRQFYADGTPVKNKETE